MPNAEDLAMPFGPTEVESKVKDSEAKVEIAEKMAMEAEKNPLPEERAGMGRVHYQSVPFPVGGPSKCTHSAIFQFHFWFISIFISILSYSIFCLSLFIMFHHCPIIFFVVQSLFMKLQMKFQMNLQKTS